MKKILTLIFVLIAFTSYSQPFAKIQPDDDNGEYVNVYTLNYCNIIYGKDIYTPQGKVTKSNLQGFTECPNLPECITAIYCDEKHLYSADSLTYNQANIDARNKGYITFIYDNKIYKTK